MRFLPLILIISITAWLLACDPVIDDVTVATPPTVLDFASMPATGQTLSPGGDSRFEITGLTPGTLYSVSIAGNNNTQLSVFNANFSIFLCIGFASTGSGSCSASPSGTSLYLRVRDNSGFGDTFTLDVTVATPTVLDFASMPATGQMVSPAGDSLFEITGLTPGTLYSVSIAGNNNTRLFVLDDPNFYIDLCIGFAYTGSGNCSASPSGTSLFLRVRDNSGLGDTFTLDIIVATPTVLDFASMPATGQTLSPGGEALYEITGLTPETIYSASIAGNTSTQLSVFNDPNFYIVLCIGFAPAGSGTCSATPSGTSLYLRVRDYSGTGDTFTLDIIVPTPTTLDFASMPATGQTLSSGGEALYEITGLTPETIYSVSIAAPNNTQLSVFNDPNFSIFLCIGFGSTGSGSCSATPSGTSLFLRVSTSGTGATFSLDVTVAPP